MLKSNLCQLALPTWEQTASTEAAILSRQFERLAHCLVEDGCGNDLRDLLDVLGMINWTHTSRHVLAGAVRAMKTNRKEIEEDYERFSRLQSEVFSLRKKHLTSLQPCI